jgi:hypothetical protein
MAELHTMAAFWASARLVIKHGLIDLIDFDHVSPPVVV